MFKQPDQAEGLRRMMSQKAPQVLRFINVMPEATPQQLYQVAGHLHTAEQRLLLIQQHAYHHPTAPWPSLSAVARGESSRNLVTRGHPLGFDCAYLIENNPLSSALSTHLNPALASIVEHISASYDTVMIETRLSDEMTLPLPQLLTQAYVIQMGHSAEAIKAAYRCIKQLSTLAATPALGILVQDATDLQAQQTFLRLQQVCLQFLGLSLQFIGALPKANSADTLPAIGTRVRAAFAKPEAATALKTVASRLEQAAHRNLVAA